jgi:hypothetical protein
MAVVRFDQWAIEWDRVYAVKRTQFSERRDSARQVELYADLPWLGADAPSITLEGPDAWWAWERVIGDDRFSGFDDYGSLRVDLSKIVAIRTAPDNPDLCELLMQLADDRHVTVRWSRRAVNDILMGDTIDQPRRRENLGDRA